MTTPNSLPQPATVVEAVEEYLDSLPAARRRKRTHAEIYNSDQSPENENYAVDSAPEPDNAVLAEFRKLLRQLGQAKSDVVALAIEAKIYRLLGLEME